MTSYCWKFEQCHLMYSLSQTSVQPDSLPQDIGTFQTGTC